VLVTAILAALTLLSVVLLVWQFIAALRFPLHQRIADDSFSPAITLLKPLKGCDEQTAKCLRSWFTQEYSGAVQLLFAVQEPNDPVCDVVRELLKEFPNADAELVITAEVLGPNRKVSNLVQLMRHAKHELICVSDSDVRVPGDLLANAVAPLRVPEVGLVNCFYQLANPTTVAMRWEAIAVNADFWSQVLQSNTLKPQNFALGAVMITRSEQLEKIGGFESLLDYLADDYQLGRKIAATGARIELSSVVVECWDKPMNFADVWRHQLRWARTIRASQPVPYFFSILSNTLLWSASLAVSGRFAFAPLFVFGTVLAARILVALALQRRLTGKGAGNWWLVPLKDLLQMGIWAAAFLGRTVNWAGRKFVVCADGKLAAR
jgi:ceramide glucosyltransferase